MNVTKIFRAPNIYNLDISFFKDKNYKIILIDLDNTLEVFDVKEPSNKTKDFIDKITKNGLKIIICSNNSQKRVSKYAKILKVDFISRCFKPFPFKINKYLRKNRISKNECILIGDQYCTDIICSKKLKVDALYTEELAKKNANVTKFNKFFEKIFVKKAYKNGVINKLEEKYGCIKES